MTTRIIMWVGTLTVLLAAPLAAGDPPCTGDCDDSNTVIVSELVLATGIGLGTDEIEDCTAADPGGDGVGVDDLVESVLNSFTDCGANPPPTATATPSITPTSAAASVTPTATVSPTTSVGPGSCGDGVVQEGEMCDDGSICTSVGEVQRCTANDQCPSGQECETDGFCHCEENEDCPTGQECSDDGYCFQPCTGEGQCPTGECRPVGGDDCAANCTEETRRPGSFIPCSANDVCSAAGGMACAGSCVQARALFVPVVLRGSTALITGEMRDEMVMGPEGQLITNAGEVPVAIKAADTQFTPTSVFNTICACVKPVPQALFGPGNSGAGIVGCGDQGLNDVNFLVEQDHNTTPGDAGNSGPGSGFPDDPECDEEISTQGVPSLACTERQDEACMENRYMHPGVCNSPRRITFSGGPAPRGAILIFNSTAITQLSDGGVCTAGTPGACEFPDYGPDCAPCTRDDDAEVVVNVTPTTSGVATVRLFDANSSAGAERLEEGATCNGPLCKVSQQGAPVDCDMLEGNSSLGGTLATAFPGIDGETIRDTITTTTLSAESVDE